MKQNLNRKPVIIRVFSVTGITGLIFSFREYFFKVLSKGVARDGPRGMPLLLIKMLFQIFKINFS